LCDKRDRRIKSVRTPFKGRGGSSFAETWDNVVDQRLKPPIDISTKDWRETIRKAVEGATGYGPVAH
jgi:hypothetical protein